MVRLEALVVAVMLVMVAVPAESGSRVVRDTLAIDWEPDPLRLLEGAEGTVHMDVRSLANVTMGVGFLVMHIKSAGASGGNITPDLIELQPGENQRVEVRIHSYGGTTHDVSDLRVHVYWGPNLTRGGATWPYLANWTSWDEVVIPVTTVPTSLFIVMGVVVLVVVIVVGLLVMAARKRRPSTGPSPGPPYGERAK